MGSGTLFPQPGWPQPRALGRGSRILGNRDGDGDEIASAAERRAGRHGGTSTGVFVRAGSTRPPDRDGAVQHPPPAGHARPRHSGGTILTAKAGGAGDPSAEGALDVFGLEEGLLQGHGAHAVCRAAVPSLARLPRGTRGAGNTGDALLSHGAWGAHLAIARWSLGTWKRWREKDRWQ